MSKISQAYKCSNCGEWHDNEYSAIECCTPDVIRGWKCDACGNYYKIKEHAENCCGHQCSQCGEWNDELLSICEHCGNDMESDPPTPAELEAAGQQRLML